jgi:hypothetical protein
MNPDKEIIRKHGQLYECSCTPMAVELVLKLIDRAPADYFELQHETRNNPVSFAKFNEREINGVKFHRRFSVDGGRGFSPEKMKDLFETIDRELDEERYVIISISHDGHWHDFVIYDHGADGEYRAVSKAFRADQSVRDDSDTWRRSDIRKKVTEMTGTDILTYDPLG